MDEKDKMSMIMESEEAVDNIFHKYGLVFDHFKIRKKIRELLDEEK